MTVSSVVVVGAGPVGLTLALALDAAGVPVTVFEAEGRQTPVSWKGSTIHPPTLELFDGLGLATTLVEGGVVVDRLQYRDTELDTYAELDYSALADDTEFPFRLQFEQYKLLELLRARCEGSRNVHVRYHQQIVGIEDFGRRQPAVVVRGAMGSEEVPADLVVGADGASSSVRKLLQVGFEGTTYPHLSAVLATDYDLTSIATDLGPVSYWTSPYGKVSMIRTPDHWRVVLTVPTGMTPEESRVFALQQLRRLFDVPADLSLNQATAYHTHQRVATSLRSGRVCLIGDAAHVNSPTGGLGLNSGIHDAFDLAARVAAGLGAGEVADSYAEVRAEVAHQVVQQVSTENTLAAASTDRSNREQVMARWQSITTDRDRATKHLLRVSMLDAARTYPPGVAAPRLAGGRT